MDYSANLKVNSKLRTKQFEMLTNFWQTSTTFCKKTGLNRLTIVEERGDSNKTNFQNAHTLRYKCKE